ncbi:MAG TPA: sigma 54 modulation/S30EA ribosomal C-terminal domain-containing protein, partial [Gaiellaceae bacterium]|nr:sigma 54 modulation/S30EA ribosomal C-terminal domain-containing protein [Gaiellaceae bacterium]
TPRGRRALGLDLLPAQPLPGGTGTVTVHARGSLPARARRDLEEVLGRVARLAPGPLLHARGSLERLPDPSLERPVSATGHLELSGHAVRAHIEAPSVTEALSALEDRLRRRLRDVGERAQTARREGRPSRPGAWRHGDLPAEPHGFVRPLEERQIVRRMSFASGPMTPEEAAWERWLLDLDFHLFTDVDAHEEALVYRREDGTPGLKRIEGGGAYVEPFLLDPEPAPTLSAVQAVERLDAAHEPFLFFVESESRRGAVLHLRSDGHYGLVTPPAS